MGTSFLFDIVKKNMLIFLLLAVGLILLIIGIFQYITSQKPHVTFEKGSEVQEVAGATTKQSEIMVDVEGSVMKPGVYKLSSDARIQDALVAAGGLSSDANREYVSKKLNQAQKLSDGMKLYIPSQTEQNVLKDIMASSTEANSSLININSASSSELDSLPGIGAVTAGKIIAGRPYSSLEELSTRKIVSTSVFEKIKEKISIN